MSSNNLGSIYATTISSEKYIIIASQNIELSGNVIIKNDATLSSGLLYTNSLVPNVPNSASLGSIDKMWSNAYFNDLSINNNLQVTGNVYISGNLEASNIYTKEEIDNSFQNVYTIAEFDNSYSNIYTRGYIDQSFQNVYTRGHIDQSFQNVYTRGYIDQSFANVYTRGAIDTSYANVYTRGAIDQSFANIYTRGLVDQSFANVYTRIQFDNSYANVYTRGHIDQSFANIYTRGRIDQSFANVYTRIQVDNSFVTKSLFELSYNALVAIRGTGSGGTSVNSNIIPSSTNSYNLGSTTKFWNNAYINNLRLSNRAYQEISGDISWSAVNGYYGLAKDAYPSLNPLSSGDLAVRTWTGRTQGVGQNVYWRGVCWSPELRLFVAVADPLGTTNHVAMYSSNGINWTTVSVDANFFFTVCWSPQLRLFVALAMGGPTNNRLMTSSNGTSWTMRSLPANNRWMSICWSPELGIFVAVAEYTSSVIISSNGIDWSVQSGQNSWWYGVCWSPQLRLFVAVGGSGTSRVMISSNGVNWVAKGLSDGVLQNFWLGVCWSPELGLFVAVCNDTTHRVMISSNGMTWTAILVPQMASSQMISICWSPQLELFVAVAYSGGNRVLTSPDGINWNVRTISDYSDWIGICWSAELGIFVAVGGSPGKVLTSSLKGRPPTSYNVFDSSFNSIDETGKWTFQNMAVTTLNVTGSFTNSSDDRLKHNEVVIANGLEIIDKLNPKFYQKTFTMLDASYNGDLSGHAWTYEAGLIAQELLQIPDLSFAVSGGDYYQESYILKKQGNDISANNYDYDISRNYYDISRNYYDTSANYDICYNLIKQPYSLNYNSVFVYGVAAIKELHAKVKAQETNVLDEQLNNLITRIETMETTLISPQ
jgi:hypothetical protein